MKKAVGTRALRNSAPQAGWQEWISEAAAARTAAEVTVMPRPHAATADGPALHEAIARLAYAHWLERGCPCGSPDEDWLFAEKQLLQAAERA